MNKTVEEACQLFEELAKNNYQATSDMAMGRRSISVLEVDHLLVIQAQLAALTNHITRQAQKEPTMGQMEIMKAQTLVDELSFELENVHYVNNNKG